MTPYQIRPATMADMPALNQLVEAAVRQLNAPDYTLAQLESALQYAYGIDTQLILDGTYFVVEVNGRLVGSGGWSQRKTLYGNDKAKPKPDNDILLNPGTDAAKMRAFFVHPQFSRQGIGRALMTTSEAAARCAGFTQLELIATLTGEPLYATMGYILTNRFSVTLPDGTPFAVAHMVKTAEPEFV